MTEIQKILPLAPRRGGYTRCLGNLCLPLESLLRKIGGELKREENKNTTMEENPNELPPFVKTWKQFYYLLIFWLVLLIALFYAFTKYFQ